MLRSTALVVVLVPIATALNCFNFQASSALQQFTVSREQCQPGVQYCVKTARGNTQFRQYPNQFQQQQQQQNPYAQQMMPTNQLARDQSIGGGVMGQDSHACDTQNMCRNEGCTRTNSFEETCCCRDDFCNGVDAKSGFIAMAAPVLVYLANRML